MHVNPSIHSSVCLSVCLSVSVCLFVCLPACLPVCLSVCLPVCLSVCLQDTLQHSKGIGTLTKKTKAPQITEEDKFKAAIEVKKNAMKSSVADLWKRLQVSRKGREVCVRERARTAAQAPHQGHTIKCSQSREGSSCACVPTMTQPVAHQPSLVSTHGYHKGSSWACAGAAKELCCPPARTAGTGGCTDIQAP